MNTLHKLSISCILLIASFSLNAVNVTFQVDMSQQTVPPEGIHIAGNFQGWDPAATAMTDIGGNIYAYTQSFTDGDSLQFKYINGDEWGEDESVPAECAFEGNRLLIVPATNTTLTAVCWGSCNPCGVPVDITFQVDMSEVTVSTSGVHIAGSFQGWNPASTFMNNMGNDMYAVTITLSSGDYHEYKFINGATWTDEEIVPAACGVPNGVGGFNRFLTIPNTNTTLTDVCFSSCWQCGFVPVEIDVTFQVDMSEETVSPNGVHLAGSFQGWDPAATELTDIGNSVYATTLTLYEDDYHVYKFINGDAWGDEEIVPPACGVDDGNGAYNRYLTVPGADTTLPDLCFSSCYPCGMQPPDINVTFQVDMTEEIVSANGIHLAGSFQGWDPAVTEMTMIGNNIYAVTLVLTATEYYEFKYFNGNTWNDEEIVPPECGVDNGVGGYNRYLVVPQADTTTTAVCFSSCDPCTVSLTDISTTTSGNWLGQNSPNPFSNSTEINFRLAEAGNIKMSILSHTGQVIRILKEEMLEPGNHKISFNTYDIPGGLYYYMLEISSDNYHEKMVRKMIIHK